ncbi:hypothetical protein CCMA1212_005001, partial [Trichoderma ghanense]
SVFCPTYLIGWSWLSLPRRTESHRLRSAGRFISHPHLTATRQLFQRAFAHVTHGVTGGCFKEGKKKKKKEKTKNKKQKNKEVPIEITAKSGVHIDGPIEDLPELSLSLFSSRVDVLAELFGGRGGGGRVRVSDVCCVVSDTRKTLGFAC